MYALRSTYAQSRLLWMGLDDPIRDITVGRMIRPTEYSNNCKYSRVVRSTRHGTRDY